MSKPTSFHAFLEQNSRAVPEGPALLQGERVLNHDDLRRRCRGLAAGLAAQGVRPGDRVATMLRNCPELVEMFIATALVGAVAVPLNYRLAENELRLTLEDIEARAIVVGPGFENVWEIADGLGGPQVVKIGLPGVERSEDVLDYEQLAADDASGFAPAAVRPDTLLALMFTGGTTGRPKGAMLTHGSVLSTIGYEIDGMGIGAETMLASMPLFHIGILHALTVLAQGGSVVLQERVEIPAIAAAIERHGVTMTVLLPTSVGELLDQRAAAGSDLSTLRFLLYGAAPMSPDVARRASAELGEVLVGVYGLTESGGVVCSLRGSDHLPGPDGDVPKLMSVGRPLPGVSIECRDEDGNPLPADTEGEIVIAADSVMAGYWRRPELSADAVRDGFLHTGDIGVVDGDGYVFLRDRKSNMIITGGENVYPREVEDVLTEHPDVHEAGVIGLPDERWGEAVTAFVVLDREPGTSAEELMEHCRRRLTGYKRPKRIVFIASLPRTVVGKVDRRALRELAAAQVDAEGSMAGLRVR
jgi:acyl-CoA synthetase (AMP-forming)/AMP-acid ligase II